MNSPKSFSQAYALIIAISEYEGNNSLPEVVTKDALDVVDLLLSQNYCGYSNSNVKKLINSEATLYNIRKEMHELAKKAGENDTVFIYFSGHGVDLGGVTMPQCGFVPVDFSKKDVGFFMEEEISHILSQINSQRLFFVIDACHSAGIAGFKSILPNKPIHLGFSDKSLERLSQGKGKVLLASSRATETSLILPGDKNSLFTKHFLEALKGDAGSYNEEFIRVFDVFSYIENRIPQEAQKFNSEQHPVFKSNLENNFPIALRCGGVQKNVNSNEKKNHIRDKKIEDILADLYPGGPSEQDVWLRAGGDLSRLKLNGTGRAQWFSALRILQQGGGGVDISIDTLMAEVRNDFPNHGDLP